MSEDEELKTLGRFKTEFLRLEDSIEHTLTHQSACELVNEAKREFFDALIKLPENPLPMKNCFLKWFGNP